MTIPQDKAAAASEILQQIENLVMIAEPEDLARLQQSLEPKVVPPSETALAKRIAGKDFSSGHLLELQLANLQRYYHRRRELLASSITSTQVAELLGCQNRSTVRDRRIAQKILGIKDQGIYKYPIWQFDPEGDDGVIDGLPSVLAALDVSDFVKLNWLCKPHLRMNGKTPLEMLKIGEITTVVTEAKAVGIGW